MQTRDVARERLFNMRMSDEEYARALLVAQHYGLNLAGAVRMLFKREADRITREEGAAPKPARKSTKR